MQYPCNTHAIPKSRVYWVCWSMLGQYMTVLISTAAVWILLSSASAAKNMWSYVVRLEDRLAGPPWQFAVLCRNCI
jgi:hypothetical protein